MNKENLINKLGSLNFPSNILKAFSSVDRADFVPPMFREFAYEDKPLPIGYGQTISQPFTIAFMLKLLELDKASKVLEVGSGSGYVLALMSQIVPKAEIYGVEKKRKLFEASRERLSSYDNINIKRSEDGLGWSQKAPFDRILVSASAQKIPESLLEQLNEGGIMVCPVKESIYKVKKRNKELDIKEFPGFLFVPLSGEE